MTVEDARQLLSQYPGYVEVANFFSVWENSTTRFEDALQWCPAQFLIWACDVLELSGRWQTYLDEMSRVDDLLKHGTYFERQLLFDTLHRELASELVRVMERRMADCSDSHSPNPNEHP